MHCEPASSIIRLLGGLTAVSVDANTTPTTVQRWRLPKEKGGTGGFIPRKYHDALIAMGAKKGITLTASSFVDPAAVPEPLEAA